MCYNSEHKNDCQKVHLLTPALEFYFDEGDILMRVGGTNKSIETLLAELEDRTLYTWSKLVNDFGEETSEEALKRGYIYQDKNSVNEYVYKITNKGIQALREGI